MNSTLNEVLACDIERQTTNARKAEGFKESLEYQFITHLVMQQYHSSSGVNFQLLFNMDPQDRIAGLIQQYGSKKMFQLILMMIKESLGSAPFSNNHETTEHTLKLCTCDFVIIAVDEALAIEDFIIFFERTKSGCYGALNQQTHDDIFNKFDHYLLERATAFRKLEEKTLEAATALSAERTCSEPTPIGAILQQASLIEMNKRMSG
jgi:hypothetical protein